MKWAKQLSEQQAAVVRWVVEGEGSLNLVARAGCGKTFTLVRGAVRAIVEHDLGEIALMAYNKDAATEFKERVKLLADETGDRRFGDWRRVDTGTVHSFGFRVVRKWSPDVVVDQHKVRCILESCANGDTKSVYAREEQAIGKLVSLAKQSAVGYLWQANNSQVWYELAEHHAVDDLVEGSGMDEVVTAAQRTLMLSRSRDREAVDFDDMILVPLVHNLRIWPKDWVLIDEAQDTNAARRALALRMLKPRTGRLIAVGDDRQAIYGFTGADSDAMDLIARELGSATLPLTVTYRCPKTVVQEANRLVPDLVAHKSAPQGSVTAVPEVAVDAAGKAQPWFLAQDSKPGHKDAVLCRNTKPLLETAYSMLAHGVGCKVRGREIGEGLVKLATRWKRVKNLQQLTEKLEDYRDREVKKWLAKGREDRAQGVEDKVTALLVVAGALQKDGKTEVADLVRWIKNLFDDREGGNLVTLCTIHKSKGREWPGVYLLHRDKTLPSKWARKEWQFRQEENLEYVAVTRAQERLVYVD